VSGRRPDYILKAVLKERAANGGEAARKVGAAWINEGEDETNISIQLDPFVVLNGNDEMWLTLYSPRP
jgi:hypothetical protein